MTNSSLSCSDARHLIHLSVGDDTVADEEQQLTDHLSGCAECRSYHAGMVDAMHVVERVRDNDTVPELPSLWPAMASKLKAKPVRSKTTVRVNEGRRFNVSVAALCACSMMLAFVTALRSLPSGDDGANSDLVPFNGMNVDFAEGQNQSQLLPIQGSDGRIYLVDPRVLMQQQNRNQQPSLNRELRF